MAIPQIVKCVDRPSNTIIVDTGVESSHRFAVRKILSPEERGAHQNTKYGPIVGYIANGTYIPKDSTAISTLPPMLSFGGSVLLISVLDQFLIDSLATAFGDIKIAQQIIVIAGLKVLHPGITQSALQKCYRNSYLSVAFPGVSLSKNTVSSLYNTIGLSSDCRAKFHKSKILQIGRDNVVIIDGTIVQDTSIINCLSQYSYKNIVVKAKNCIFLYDNTAKDIVTSETYPGNFSDASVFRDFLVKNHIYTGILVGDRAFYVSVILSLKKQYPSEFSDLRFIMRLKSNDKRIVEYNLKVLDDIFVYGRNYIGYKKVKTEDGLFLYSFKNFGITFKLMNSFVENCYKKNDNINNLYYRIEEDGFIFAITNDDFEPLFVYDTIIKRFNIETVFDLKKNTLSLNSTNVQDDFTVIGQDFVNEISTSLGIKISLKLSAAGILNGLSFNDVIDDLNLAWRLLRAGEREQEALNSEWILKEGLPSADDQLWIHTTEKTADMIKTLGLSSPSKNKTDNKKEDKQDIDKEQVYKEILGLKKELKEIYGKIDEIVVKDLQNNPEAYNNECYLSIDDINESSLQNCSADLELKRLFKKATDIQNRIDALNAKLHGINVNYKKNSTPGRPKSPVTLELEQQIQSQGIDPASQEGQKLFRKLKRQAKTGNTNSTLGRPKSQETLELEQQIQSQGI